ncbi:MAG: hypothetical protein QOG41_1631 [Thermoleophilaceae bacterium]|nr:hypothetical protein [Thermoleophilaceae bacterium]MEA2350016.1 hypothetical protein [Thermoleophilaceae bacterium]MEA2352999.1 hypothetical protein [Thermoleophilaceae bacterium]MEA2369137.1 hypothetical protein [Thermoleophilaceae bacterium]MEA2388858.1 hypothetical protein [Thermoleophilaceae bacterium]
MTRVGRTRVAVLLVGGLAMPAIAGCGGGSDFKNKPRPPAPVELSGVITDKAVSVEPSKLGAGPVTILISNQSKQSHTVTLEGGPHNTTEQVGPINPLDAARIQETLEPGTYTVKAGSDRAAARQIKPATLAVGKERESSSGQVLLP